MKKLREGRSERRKCKGRKGRKERMKKTIYKSGISKLFLIHRIVYRWREKTKQTHTHTTLNDKITSITYQDFLLYLV